MATLRDLKKRIVTVKNTQQVTKAMKMVSASKLRRSQTGLMSLRPYAYKIIGMLNSLKERGIDLNEHPLLRKREVKKVKILVITSDRGLCGSFNNSIIKRADMYIKEKNLSTDAFNMAFIGKKGYDFFSKKFPNNMSSRSEMGNIPLYDTASSAGDKIIADYIAGDFDSLVVIYNEFKSVISQKVVVEGLLPIVPDDYKEYSASDNFIYEPSKEEFLEEMLPKFVKVELFRIMLESSTSEHAARMTAMDNATNNSIDMIRKLTLDYNRQRQAAITKELMEIVGGKEALDKG